MSRRQQSKSDPFEAIFAEGRAQRAELPELPQMLRQARGLAEQVSALLEQAREQAGALEGLIGSWCTREQSDRGQTLPPELRALWAFNGLESGMDTSILAAAGFFSGVSGVLEDLDERLQAAPPPSPRKARRGRQQPQQAAPEAGGKAP